MNKMWTKKEEIAHHINKNTKDNRIENLKLFNNQSEHLLEHWKNKDIR